jgi:uncharacterized protein
MEKRTLPEKIDLIQWANNSAIFKGLVDLNDFERLCESLHKSDELAEGKRVVSVDLTFKRSRVGVPTVYAVVKGQLPVTCERCLEAFELEVDSQFEAVVDGIDETLIDEDIEFGETDDEGQFLLKSLIEDELLLNLPVAPKHDSECIEKDALSHGEIDESEADNQVPKGFEALADLKAKLKGSE